MASDGDAALDDGDVRNSAAVVRKPSMVLFLPANPVESKALKLAEECRVIEDALRGARFQDQIRFRPRWAVRFDDLLQALNEEQPSVLHFSGNGGNQGLCFELEDGSALSMSSDSLSTLTRIAGDSVSMVVLNACYSEVQAQALVANVPCVIGTPGTISDKAAATYAAALYRALAFGKSVGVAHEHGLAALSLARPDKQARDLSSSNDNDDIDRPKLLTREGVDAREVYLAPQNAHKPRCTIVIQADVQNFSPEVLARVMSELRRLSGDVSVTVVDVETGSVRLTISLSKEGVQTIVRLRAEGQLNQIDGLEISAVIDPQAIGPASTTDGDMRSLKGIALCCGFNNYDDKPLRRAVNDAAMLYARLTESGMYNCDPDLDKHGMLFTNRILAQDILDAFTRATLSTADLVWFSFSGHSLVLENGELRLLLPGWRLDSSEETKRMYSIGADELESAIRSRSSNKKLVILLDSCQSGAFGSGIITRDVATPVEQRIASAGAVVIASCARDQLAVDGHAESRDPNGEFTGAIIQTLDYYAHTGMPLRVLQLFESAKNKITNGQSPILNIYGLTDNFLVFEKGDSR